MASVDALGIDVAGVKSSREEVDPRLRQVIRDIHEKCIVHGLTTGGSLLGGIFTKCLLIHLATQ